MPHTIDPTKFLPLIEKIIKKYDDSHKEDLTQECYLKILEIAPDFDTRKGKIQTYLYLPLVNHCATYMNESNKRNHLSLDESLTHDDEQTTFADLLEDGIDTDKLYTNRDMLERVKKRMPKKHFQVIEKLCEGYTAEEITQLLKNQKSYQHPDSIYRMLKKYRKYDRTSIPKR